MEKIRFDKSNSFEELVKLHQEKVLNTCFRFVKNKEDAEDLAQDVFVEVYNHINSFRGDAKLSTWIYQISVNKSLDFIRKKKRKKRFAFVLSLYDFGDEEKELQLPTPANPHTDLEQKERTQILNKAIDSLPENQKAANPSSKYEGFSNKAIAEIMGASVSAVDSLIHRAKNKLQKKLHQFHEKHL